MLCARGRRVHVGTKIQIRKAKEIFVMRIPKSTRAVEMAPLNGCALCERKESSRWHKNTDTGERDICAACYQNQRAVEMAPSNGCAQSRGRRVHVGTKIQIRAKEIFVMRATKINVL